MKIRDDVFVFDGIWAYVLMLTCFVLGLACGVFLAPARVHAAERHALKKYSVEIYDATEEDGTRKEIAPDQDADEPVKKEHKTTLSQDGTTEVIMDSDEAALEERVQERENEKAILDVQEQVSEE